MAQVVPKKVRLDMLGLDGNAFSLMAAFRRQARREKWTDEEIDAVLRECQSGSYNYLLATLCAHCERPDGEGDDAE